RPGCRGGGAGSHAGLAPHRFARQRDRGGAVGGSPGCPPGPTRDPRLPARPPPPPRGPRAAPRPPPPPPRPPAPPRRRPGGRAGRRHLGLAALAGGRWRGAASGPRGTAAEENRLRSALYHEREGEPRLQEGVPMRLARRHCLICASLGAVVSFVPVAARADVTV